ncbi:MAG: HAD family hydrolase [Candidatus Heimdallarchaeota archaeon]|nr:MAG: HAD family hydrolase [Candidatus Heimdallarchaeota archaeon]
MNYSSIDAFHEQNDLLKLVRKEPTHRNYWNVYKRIKKLDFSNVEIPTHQRINIALLSSFTIDPLAIYLDIDCRLKGLFPEIYIAPFNRFQEEVINERSGLYQSQPDIIIFFVEVESLLEDMFRVKFPQMKTEHRQAELDRVIQTLKQLLTLIHQRSESLILFSNFILPAFSPFGILDNKQEIGFKRFYQSLNIRLEKLFRESKQVFIFDLNEVASNYGKDKYMNYPMNYRGSLLFTESFLPRASYELMGYINALKSKNRKCIVLDLDGTLWGGIIGEDELDGIKLNVTYPGNEFMDFQRSLLSLSNRGVILAVNSKNNLADALEVFQKHPFMLIKEKNLAAYRINWNDKVQNLIELSKEINIGLDSIVFFDDNPIERERIKTSLPEVHVIELPSSPTLFRQTLERMNDFNTLSLTKEDLNRSEMYYARRKRQVLEQQIQSIEEFIKSLNIVAKIRYADDLVLPRVTNLLNRTNQFNLTTRRYTDAEIRQMYSNSEKYLIYTLEVVDKFGHEGTVGVAIVKINSEDSYLIDSFLMSCRVIGRKIETSFLYKIIKDAQKKRVKNLEAEYIPTKKNSLVKDFYPKHGFQMLEKRNDGQSRWVIHPLDTKVIYPEYIQVVEE